MSCLAGLATQRERTHCVTNLAWGNALLWLMLNVFMHLTDEIEKKYFGYWRKPISFINRIRLKSLVALCWKGRHEISIINPHPKPALTLWHLSWPFCSPSYIFFSVYLVREGAARSWRDFPYRWIWNNHPWYFPYLDFNNLCEKSACREDRIRICAVFLSHRTLPL